MKKIFFWVFISTALIAFILFFFSPIDKIKNDKKESLKEDVIIKKDISLNIPLTGSLAFIGEQIKNGAELALSEFKDSVLTIGYEDNKGNSRDGIGATNKILSVDNPDFVIVNLTSVSMASKPILSQKDLIAIYLSTYPTILDGCNNCYRFFTSGKQEGDLISNEILKDSITTLGLMYVNDGYGKGTSMYVKKLLDNLGIEFIDLAYPINGFDFQQLVTSAKGKKLDALLVIGYGFEYSTLFKKLNDLNYYPNIYSNFSFSNVEGQAINNYKGKIIYTAPKFDNVKSRSNHMIEFVSKYVAKYGKVPDFNAAYGYDNIKIIHDYVLGKNKDFKEFLSSFNYNGAMGHYDFLKNGDVKTQLEIIRR